MNATRAEENYLKAIYHLTKRGVSPVLPISIAEDVDVNPASVVDMIKKLVKKDFINYSRKTGAILTDLGTKIATGIVRKHRIWEVFLVEKLNFSWDEVHEVAEQLEHIKSEKLINQLDAFLEFPTHDPHGDPIPDKEGQIKKIDKILLSQVDLSGHCICVGVKDTSPDFLKYLDKNKIALGAKLQVLHKEPFDSSIVIKTANGEFSVSQTIANNLFVKIN